MNRKQKLAAEMWLLADLEQANSTRRSFSSRAYREAVWALDHLPSELTDDRSLLLAIPGIGSAIADLILEFGATGGIARLARLRQLLPVEAGQLARLPRMTPTRLRAVKREFGIDTVADFRSALASDSVGQLPGVGQRTSQVWLERLGELGRSDLPIQRAVAVADRFRRHLATHLPGREFEVVGAVARLDEWVETIEMVASSSEGLLAFLAQSALIRTVRDDPPAATTLAGRLQFVKEAVPEKWSTSLRSSHLRGDLHVHTDWSPDGRQTLETAVETASQLGWAYLAITDHGAGLRFGGLEPDALSRQREEIGDLDARVPIKVLQGAELNIDRYGNLDYDDAVLSRLDFRLAGVHSNFGLERIEQTERVIRAINHPLVDVIAHLTGRRIGVRPPIDLDLRAVFEAAAASATALEVNGHLDRLDLSAENVASAAALGVLFAVNSDAHRPSELRNIVNGIKVLGRAGVPPEQVINTWEVGRLLQWLARSRT
jgi:histidinol phosphatase-like PHP family hydrolase